MSDTQDEIVAFIADAARMRGVNEWVARAVAQAEGGTTSYNEEGSFPSGHSFWPFQLHYGGAEYPQFGYSAGLGTPFTKLTGWQPGDVRAWRDSIRYALNIVKRDGWTAWYGATDTRDGGLALNRWSGIERARAWDPNAEAWDFELLATPNDQPFHINYDQPPERQIQSWACSIRVTTWLLKSLGVDIDAGDLQEYMVPRYVTPDLGLLDHTGEGMVTVLRAKLPGSVVITTDRVDRFDSLPSLARAGLVGLGSQSLYHWIAVRHISTVTNGIDSVRIMNPAPGYHGIGDDLSREQFYAWEPWNAVVIELPDA